MELSQEGSVGRSSVPRSMTGLRSRRELGSFYMRRKENGETVGVSPGGGGVCGGILSPTGGGGGVGGGGGGGGFAPRRAPGVSSVPKANANAIMETFAKLSPQDREKLVQDLERRSAGGGGGMASNRKNLPRPMSRSLELDGMKSSRTSEGSSGGKVKRDGGAGKLIENPVEVSSRSNLSDFSDAEEVESEDLEGESREVGEEVERWLTEGFVEQNGTRKVEGGTCEKCEQYGIKISAMESAMGKMQAEMAELRVRLKKADKKSKSWVKIPGRSSRRTTGNGDGGGGGGSGGGRSGTTEVKRREMTEGVGREGEENGRSKGGNVTGTDTSKMAKELDRLRLKLEDTEMERDAYKQAAKLHVEALIEKQDADADRQRKA